MWDRRAQIVSVRDADSVRVILDQGFGDTKEDPDGLRLLGVYAPELDDPGGPECHDFVQSWVDRHRGTAKWPFVVITARRPIADREQESLSRYVGTVTNSDGTENLNAAIIDFIHAQGYGGGTGS